VTCPRCLYGERTLFWLPGTWTGGICEECALSSPEFAAAFRAHFGKVRYVSDGDVAKGQAKAGT
jgi:hypothetical protein